MRSIGERLADRLRAFAQPWEIAVYVWVPAVVVSFTFWYELRSHRALQDFGIFRTAARSVLHGRSPYPAAELHAFAHFDQFVYPPSSAFFFAPLAELPIGVAQVVMLVLGVACILVALRLLGVRDWRCYGVAVMSAPAVNSVALGEVTTFLLVGVAATWRYRDRPALAGPVAALTAVGKVILWPLGLWLLVTRRLRAAAVFAGAAVCIGLGGWAAIDFAGMRSYPHLLHVLSQAEQGTSYSPVALLRLSGGSATALSVALVAVVALAVVLAARGADGERRAFAVAVLGALLATPILWLHYFLLLLVPIALYRPRVSALWFAPVVLWLTPTTHSHGVVWRIVLALCVLVVVVLRTLAERRTRWLVAWPRRIRMAVLGRTRAVSSVEAPAPEWRTS